jgi:hypothetical protein
MSKKTRTKVPSYKRKDGTRVKSFTREKDVRGVWFAGRRTAIVVKAKDRNAAITKARTKLRRGGSSVSKVRSLTDSELKTAQRGGWVRSGPGGEKPGYGAVRGFGPPSKKYLAEQKPVFKNKKKQ